MSGLRAEPSLTRSSKSISQKNAAPAKRLNALTNTRQHSRTLRRGRSQWKPHDLLSEQLNFTKANSEVGNLTTRQLRRRCNVTNGEEIMSKVYRSKILPGDIYRPLVRL